MPLDSDVALLGTGAAPLAAASRLLAEGKSVLILNPDWDFFIEDSELSLDPLWPQDPKTLKPKRLMKSSPDHALQELKPVFPGALEIWPRSGDEGYHDRQAPHVRLRSRLWIQSSERWSAIEDMYVEAADANLKPQILEGIAALKRFPGYASRAPREYETKGVLLPKMIDVDVSRYRNGLLEFVRERLAPERIVTGMAQLELAPDGLRFYSGGSPRTARLRDGIIVFWTPRLSRWVLSQAKRLEVKPLLPRGVRLWEEWSLVSRESLDPSIIGGFEDMTVVAEVEGAPNLEVAPLARLAVFKPGPLIPVESSRGVASLGETHWASSDSFASLSRLCNGFLGWEKFSVRSMKPRAIFEWQKEQHWQLFQGSYRAEVVCGCDGPLTKVLRRARQASERMLDSGRLSL